MPRGSEGAASGFPSGCGGASSESEHTDAERKRKRDAVGMMGDGGGEGWCGHGDGASAAEGSAAEPMARGASNETRENHGVVPSIAGARLATTLSDELLRVRGA